MSSGRPPKYRGPKNGQAFVKTVRLNGGRETYLGKYKSPASYRAYADCLKKLAAPPAERSIVARCSAGESLSIVELVLLYRRDAEQRYAAPSGGTRDEFRNVMDALRNLEAKFGDLDGAAIEPAHLVELQRYLIAEGISRKLINKRIAIVKRFFAWCCLNHAMTGLPKHLYHDLTCVKGLIRGEYGAVDRPKVLPVPLPVVEKTIPWLSPVPRAMVQIQLICGMRPQEVCTMRTDEIEHHGQHWVYRPEHHKNAWRGNERFVAIPPIAQQILEPLLDDGPYIFTPAKNAELRQAERQPKPRTTRRYPCESRRVERIKAARRAAARQRLAQRYTPETYWQAVDHAFAKAARHGVEIPKWSPNRLRHSISTKISQTLGQQQAQRWLGHENLATTDIYTDLELSELLAIADRLENHWNATIFARTPGIVCPALNCSTSPRARGSSSPTAIVLPAGSSTMSNNSMQRTS